MKILYTSDPAGGAGPGPTLEDLKRELAQAREALKEALLAGERTAKERETDVEHIKELQRQIAELKKTPLGPPTKEERKSWAPWD